MIKSVPIGTLALLVTAALSAAQTPQAQGEKPATTTAQTTAMLEGCLYRESQVPGRTPNIVERAGVLEDYILADATMPAPTRPGTPREAVGTSGTTPSTGNMYKVENIPDDRLKTLVGKRVQVSGRIDPEATGLGGASAKDRGPGPDKLNLPEFEASSISEIAGTCPAAPASPK